MRRFPAIRLAFASLIAAMLPLGAHAQARNELSAKDAQYACPAPKETAALIARAGELYPAKYDKNKLGCAADLFYQAAVRAPEDIVLQLQALGTTVEYLDHVNTLWDFDIYGIRQPEWSARISHAMSQGDALALHLREIAPQEPAVLAATSLYEVVANFKAGDARAQLGAARDAIRDLEVATTKEPGVLDGAGLFLLARLYYDLPEFSGGDVDKALALLPRALEIAPGNPSVVRYYAYVLDQERRSEEARQVLARLLTFEPGPTDLQLAADELRYGRDLAAKFGDATLEKKLDRKRKALLEAHPDLLTRNSSAANQHGGVDPISGETY